MACDVEPLTRLKQLNQRASDFVCDDKIPIARYFRSSKEMERMALVYHDEKEYENSFLLYMKLITLLVEKLPKHPQYKSANAEEKKVASKRCKNAFAAAEKIKGVLKERFEEEYNNWLAKEDERKKAEAARIAQLNKDEALRLASLKKQQQEKEMAEYKRQEEELRRANLAKSKVVANVPPPAPTTTNTSLPTPPQAYQPTPPAGVGVDTSPQVYNYGVHPQTTAKPPTHTPPPYQYEGGGGGQTANDVPSFDRTSKPNAFGTLPGIDRSTKPYETLSESSIDGNRNIVMSPDLVPRFLQLAHRNTVQNLETCGILTGKLSRNTFRISHLVIPKQSATPDSCTTECEEELFDVQDKHDLITLGWIHTHPSQTAFLSSVDLHTQCSYQQLMPEAIAIVCAPKYETVGVYRLTPSYGVNYVSSCTKSGFHPHPKEPPLYEESPLVSVDHSLVIDIIDLR